MAGFDPHSNGYRDNAMARLPSTYHAGCKDAGVGPGGHGLRSPRAAAALRFCCVYIPPPSSPIYAQHPRPGLEPTSLPTLRAADPELEVGSVAMGLWCRGYGRCGLVSHYAQSVG